MLAQHYLYLTLILGFVIPGQGSIVSTESKTLSLNTSIRGTVQIKTKIHSRNFPLNLYSRRGTSSGDHQPLPPVNEIENVVVYLEDHHNGSEPKPDADASTTKSSPSIRQLNERFIPHVLPIIVGTVVQFPNEDPFFHNVFSLSGAKSFDLGRYPKDHTRFVKFDRPGIVKVFCHIHSHMNAVILILDNPYFCVPEPNGNFVINDIPPGQYTLVVWHERLKPYREAVTLTAGSQLTFHVVL